MLSCTEQGLWPDNVSDGLGGPELDALIEHAAGCLYHERLLDQDEEEFLAGLRHTSDLLCFDPFAQIRSTGSQGDRPQEIRPPAAEETRRGPVSVRDTADALYDRYRRWSDERCPVEILQVRCGGRNVCTLDLARDGGSWRLNVKAGDAPLQFWTVCRRHQDEVMLAAYPIPRQASGRAEASTLSFANGQSLSALAFAKGEADFDVLLHCTVPPAAGARYVVYNFDSLAGHGCLEAAGLRYCKTSRLLDDFAKLSELRFPAPDLEAARLFAERRREKNVPELLDVAADQYCHDAEPLRFYHPPEVGGTSSDAQEEGSEQAATVVALLKNWVGRQSGKHLYRPYRRMTESKRRGFHVEVSCGAGKVWREWLGSFAPHTSCDRVHLFIGAGVVPVTGSYLRFVSTRRSANHELDVVRSTTPENASSGVCRRIREYYGRRAEPENWSRVFVPFGACGREQLLPRLIWSMVLGDSADADSWHLSEADLLALCERVFSRFVKAGALSPGPYGGEEAAQAVRERLRATVGWEWGFESCAPREFCRKGCSEPFEAAFEMVGNGGGDARAWPSCNNIAAVLPVSARPLVASACSSEFYGEVPQG
jgi:hypothetical protein